MIAITGSIHHFQFALAIANTTLSTDQNTPLVIPAAIQTSFADTYALEIQAPVGWSVVSDGQVIGVVVIKIALETIEKSWASSGELISLSDENGVLFISAVPEWRYGRRGERMAWYPSVKLFRSLQVGAWEPVVLTLVNELKLLQNQPKLA